MKTLLVVAATLLSTTAFAETLTGTVHSRCMNGASTCRTLLDTTVDGVDKTVTLAGDFKKLSKYDGKDVKVDGYWMCLNGGDSCNFGVKTIKKVKKPAGESMVGTVRTLCMNGASTCRAFLDTDVGGISKSIELSGDFSKLAKFNGKIVTVDGYWMCLNGGDSCRFGVNSIEKAAALPRTLSAEGNNVGRGSNTNPTSGVSSSSSSSTGAGVKH